MLSFSSSLHSLTISTVLAIGFTNIFFQAVNCLFILFLGVFLIAQVLNFGEDDSILSNAYLLKIDFACL